MPFVRVPRKLLSLWVKYRRPKGAPEFTYRRGIHKALHPASFIKMTGLFWHKIVVYGVEKINSFD